MKKLTHNRSGRLAGVFALLMALFLLRDSLGLPSNISLLLLGLAIVLLIISLSLEYRRR
jgi:hypothetical protein